MYRDILYTVKCVPQLCNDTIQGWLKEMQEARDYRQYQSEKNRIISEMSSFENKVNAILNDQSGWSRYGVKFSQVDDLSDYIIGKKNNNSEEIKIRIDQHGGYPSEFVEILLTPSHVINQKYCPVLDSKLNLSCADLQKKKVYVNLERWIFGSDFGIDKIPLNEYQKYLINHEIGHAVFGLLHPECNNLIGYQKAPVMLQQTINLCNELYFNPYPLNEEINFLKKH